jgi:hypothetical protein
MDADFSIELGADDPVLDFPWRDPDGKLCYFDLKRHPELIERIAEAAKFSALKEFLRSLNSPISVVETAKCDVWSSQELSPEEEIYEASYKFASYVDIVFSNSDNYLMSPGETRPRLSFPSHELFAERLVQLLRHAPNILSSAEVCVRRCFFDEGAGTQEGFYCTLYVNGYGRDEAGARQNWEVGLRLMGNALLQLSASGEFGRVKK